MQHLKLKAYLSPYAVLKPHELHGAKPEQLAQNLTFWAECLVDGYTHVGEVEATVHLHNESDIVGAKVESLRATQTELRARCEREATRLEGEIQSLLSIVHQPKDL
jgi:hypothetical protein